MKKQPKPKRPRREYGIGDFLDYVSGPNGLKASAKKVQREEQMLNFNPNGTQVEEPVQKVAVIN